MTEQAANSLQLLVNSLTKRGETLSLAESCTGGLLAKQITDIPGASAILIEGIVTYANSSKVRRLGVPETLLDEHGAVSEACARAMAEGERSASGATWALAITGIAGPDGGSESKPVGTVFIALAGPSGTHQAHYHFDGDRSSIRNKAAYSAINMLLKHAQS